jgi:enoyl-CoA hydratase/carnithine racemase
MEERVRVTLDNGVADVRLTRAVKLNALDDAMFTALIETGERLKTQKGLRAVVLSGEGRAFCAGLDMDYFARMARESGAGLLKGARTPGGANRPQHAVLVWREIPVPVIAALHGEAFGGGFQLALGADMRFVTAEARLAVLEIQWGLVPDMGGIALMRGLVRDDIARELTYTGRIFSGREAVTLGLATRLCEDPRAEALALAHDIAARNPHAVRGAKRLFNLAADAGQAEILHAETAEQKALIGSPNQIEAVMANLEKRAAHFTD